MTEEEIWGGTLKQLEKYKLYNDKRVELFDEQLKMPTPNPVLERARNNTKTEAMPVKKLLSQLTQLSTKIKLPHQCFNLEA